MKLLMISKDAKVFEEGSAVRARMIEYGKLFDELHIVALAKTKDASFEEKISPRVTLYSPHSNIFFFIFLKSFGIIWKILRKQKDNNEWWVSGQDPFETGVLASLAASHFKIKLQLQIHTDLFSPQFKKERFLNHIRVFIAKRILPKAQSIRVVSERIKISVAETLKIDPKIIHVLPIFVDAVAIQKLSIVHDLRKKYPEFKKIILIASRFEKEKNIPLALSSFAKVLRKIPDAGLVIAGEGSEKSWIKKYCEHLGIEKNIRFEGWVTDMISLFKSSDALLVTSFYEGYGMTIVEALASGTPVVSTDVGVAEEVGATLVNYDPGEIALTLIDILSQGKQTVAPKLPTKEEYLKRFQGSFF